MNNKNIKNSVAFKEVFLNSGYKVSENGDELNIENLENKHAFVKEKESGGFFISLFDRELNTEDSKVLIKELKKAIDLIDYIEFMTK